MGRLFVILLATVFTVGFMIAMIPGTAQTAFKVSDHGVPWYFLIGGVVFYGYHRLTGKG
jgi:hypothetical protein